MLGIDQIHHHTGSTGVQPNVRERRLRSAQQRHLDNGRKRRKTRVNVQLSRDARLGLETFEHAAQGSGERSFVEFGGCECGNNPAHIGEVVAHERLDLFEHAAGVGRFAAVDRTPRKEPDRGEPLRDRVVDVAREPRALGDRPRFTLREGEFLLQICHLGLCLHERVDQQLALLRLLHHLDIAARDAESEEPTNQWSDDIRVACCAVVQQRRDRDDHEHRERIHDRPAHTKDEPAQQPQRKGEPDELDRHHDRADPDHREPKHPTHANAPVLRTTREQDAAEIPAREDERRGEREHRRRTVGDRARRTDHHEHGGNDDLPDLHRAQHHGHRAQRARGPLAIGGWLRVARHALILPRATARRRSNRRTAHPLPIRAHGRATRFGRPAG